MQVFIVGTPMETAKVLDSLRLRKQIIEADQILSAIMGNGAWSNHPAVLQYRGYENWLKHYRNCLIHYIRGHEVLADIESRYAELMRPEWHCDEYFNQMRRRLYAKNPEHYAQWAHLGKSEENWYWSQDENKFIKYINGKRIE